MNAPERYRKKPVVIEAMQYGPYTAPSLALAQFLAGTGAKAVTEGIKIQTLEGDMLASPGDWIIKGVKGEFYPCKPDIFAATYEPADTSATPDPLSDPRVKALVEAAKEVNSYYWASSDVVITGMGDLDNALRAIEEDK